MFNGYSELYEPLKLFLDNSWPGKCVFFLLALTTAKRIGEWLFFLHPILVRLESCTFFYLLDVVAKTQKFICA